MLDDELAVVLDDRGGTVLLGLAGRLSILSATALRRDLLKVLLDSGRVLVDVRGVVPTSAARVALFPAVLAAAGGWPDARMVLVGPPACPVIRAMTLTGREREVPVAADRRAGTALLGSRPARVRRTASLPTGVHGPALARALVLVACTDWDIADPVRERAVTVVSELVTNVVEHTEGAGELALTVDDAGLRVAVRDRSKAPLPPAGERTGGLGVIAELSDLLGVSPRLDGKTVWALLRTGPQ